MPGKCRHFHGGKYETPYGSCPQVPDLGCLCRWKHKRPNDCCDTVNEQRSTNCSVMGWSWYSPTTLLCTATAETKSASRITFPGSGPFTNQLLLEATDRSRLVSACPDRTDTCIEKKNAVNPSCAGTIRVTRLRSQDYCASTSYDAYDGLASHRIQDNSPGRRALVAASWNQPTYPRRTSQLISISTSETL
jgi:hypothetical protein